MKLTIEDRIERLEKAFLEREQRETEKQNLEKSRRKTRVQNLLVAIRAATSIEAIRHLWENLKDLLD